MRLYGRQSRVRARRRRVAARRSASSLALIAIPFGHLRAAARRDRRTACASRACRWAARRGREAEREISAAVSDELQREVTVTVAGRSATLSPYDLGVRVDAARTAQRGARRGQRARRAAVLARLLALDRPGARAIRRNLALPAELAAVTQAPVDARLVLKPSGAAIAVPAKPGVGFDPGRGAARDHGAPRSPIASRCRCARCRRRLRSRRRPRAAPRRASRSCCRRRSPSRAAARPAGRVARAAARPDAHGDDLQARDRREVRPDQGRRRAAPAALGLPAPGQGRALEGRGGSARACSRR